jgi:hypothetical protein
MKSKLFLIVFIAIAIIGCSESESQVIEKVDRSIYYHKDGVTVTKVKVDSIEYVVVKNFQSGIAIIRHSK